jgi:hypothetical protein
MSDTIEKIKCHYRFWTSRLWQQFEESNVSRLVPGMQPGGLNYNY